MNDTATILVVDDDASIRSLFRLFLKSLGHEVKLAETGIAALAILEESQPDLIFMDVQMPGISGLETLERIRAEPRYNNIPVVMASGYDDSDTVLKCLELGADDFIRKPCDLDVLRARLSGSLRRKRIIDLESEFQKKIAGYNVDLETRVREQVKTISRTQHSTIFALSKLAESRDPETGEHLDRMREYCKILCLHLRRQPRFSSVITDTFIDGIYSASPLHDVGKVGIPDRVPLEEGTLSGEKFEIIKTRTTIGANTLRSVDDQFGDNEFIRFGIDIAQSHHEKWDGSGYPDALSGEDIPLSARILALGDVYDALTSKRCYKEAFDHETAKGIILQGRGTHFDPGIVGAFLSVEQEFILVRKHYDDAELEDGQTSELASA